MHYFLQNKLSILGAGVLAHLAEGLLPTPEDLGSNPATLTTFIENYPFRNDVNG